MVSCVPASGTPTGSVEAPDGPGPPATRPSILAARDVLAAELSQDIEEPPSDVWVATYTDTVLWDGSGSDSAALGRLPIGSYFVVIGDAVGGRLPVHYWG